MSGFHQSRADPAYPWCDFCNEESDNAAGWHEACQSFVHEHDLKPAPEIHGTVGEIMEKFSWQAPYEELRRTGTGGWFA